MQIYQDPNHSTDERVADLISRLTIEEKASLLLADSAPVERLGIPKYHWWKGGQGIKETLIELNASEEILKRYIA